jgi:cysteinyl-tRNA synthetase
MINRLKDVNSKSVGVGNLLPKYIERFKECLNDSLNISKALALVNELLKSQERPEDIVSTILDFDRVFGLNLEECINTEGVDIPNAVLELANRREEARRASDYDLSDSLRDQIINLGYKVLDTQDGFKIERI